MTDDERTLFELEYWRLVLEDSRAIYDGLRAIADEVCEIPSDLLAAMLLPESHRGEQLESAARRARQAMSKVLDTTAPADRIVTLIEGRLQAIAVAQGIDAGEPDADRRRHAPYVVDRSSTTRAAAPFYAECDCGWSGPERRSRTDAYDDAAQHVAEQRAA